VRLSRCVRAEVEHSFATAAAQGLAANPKMQNCDPQLAPGTSAQNQSPSIVLCWKHLLTGASCCISFLRV
jgi:hypothetical protein